MLVFDMDNTLFDFNGSGGLERMNEKGFFAGLKPYKKAVETVSAFVRQGEKVYILSACIESPYCKAEKMESLRIHFPFIKSENVCLIPIGENKARAFCSFVGIETLNRDIILFDDYKKNLIDWMKAGGTSVKCGKQYKQERAYHFQFIKFERLIIS